MKRNSSTRRDASKKQVTNTKSASEAYGMNLADAFAMIRKAIKAKTLTVSYPKGKVYIGGTETYKNGKAVGVIANAKFSTLWNSEKHRYEISRECWDAAYKAEPVSPKENKSKTDKSKTPKESADLDMANIRELWLASHSQSPKETKQVVEKPSRVRREKLFHFTQEIIDAIAAFKRFRPKNDDDTVAYRPRYDYFMSDAEYNGAIKGDWKHWNNLCRLENLIWEQDKDIDRSKVVAFYESTPKSARNTRLTMPMRDAK